MDTQIEQRAQIVDARVRDTLAASQAAVEPVGAARSDLLDQIAASSVGGKRLRAQLVLASHSAHRGTNDDCAAGVAAAVEIFQTAALLHDDVLDDSDTRRGRPSAHRVLANFHRDNGWLGSSNDFGAAAAVLAGDITLVAAHRALWSASESLTAPAAAMTTRLFADMAELVTMGQYLDMRTAAQPIDTIATQESQIRSVMRSKTASYSAEFPLALGAACAGGDAGSIASMRAIGLPLGIAFQLRDDILGLTGSPAVTGKPAGDDIREGKRTMLVWHAWSRTDDTGRRVLAETLGHRGATDSQVQDAVDVVRATDALDKVEDEIATLAQKSIADLQALDLDHDAVDILVYLFKAATDRSS